MKRTTTRFFMIGALLAIVSLVAGGLGRVSAHEDTAAGFPAHVHSGTCDKLDPNPKYPLHNVHHGVIADVEGDTDKVVDAVKREGDRAKEMAGKPFAEMKKAAETLRREHKYVVPVHVSETVVDVPLADLLASPHAINVHESSENIETYIACGDITGTPSGKDLSVVMNPLSDSGFSGIAWLREEKNKTIISIFLTQGLNAEDAATPTA